MPQRKYPIETFIESIHQAIENNIEEEKLNSKNLTLKEIKKIIPEAVELFERSLCMDCGVDTIPEEYYMVHDEIWLKAVPENHGMLCIGCLENRLGRSLNHKDFTPALINEMNDKESLRLKTRKML